MSLYRGVNMISSEAKENIKKEIKLLENEKFILAMKDTWDNLDYREDDRLKEEINKREKMLKEENK